MSLLFGALSLKEDKIPLTIDFFKKESEFPGMIFQLLKWERFSGQILFNKKLPYQIQDKLIIDQELKLHILISGVIYNRDNLLIKNKFQSNIRTDVELIIALYKKGGKNFIEELNGDFVIIIFDNKLNQVLIFRDHLGLSPLTYVIHDDILYFSNDAMGLCKSFASLKDKNKLFEVSFIQNAEFIEYDTLPLKNVKKLLPGHYLKVRDSKILQKKYWFPESITEDYSLTMEKVIKQLKQLTDDSVKIRCDKRFTASSHLSGGLDSSLISALTRKHFKEQSNFFGFSWTANYNAPINKGLDERTLIQELANKWSIEPVYCGLTDTKEYWKILNDWKYYSFLHDEHKVVREAKLRNVNLIFSGWGGDEFLSINSRGVHYDLFFGLKWRRILKKISLKRPLSLLRLLIYEVDMVLL